MIIHGCNGRDHLITVFKGTLLVALFVTVEAFIHAPTKKSRLALSLIPRSHEIHQLNPPLAFDDEDDDDDLFLFDDEDEDEDDDEILPPLEIIRNQCYCKVHF